MPRVLRRLRLVTLALVALMLLAACGGPAQEAASPAQEQSPAPAAGEAAPAAPEIDAPGLRVALNNALREHVFLAAMATQNALGGNTEGFEAAAAAIQGNTEDLAALVGSIYPDVQAQFMELWASHITMFVDYTNGIAAGDQAKADDAVARLTTYARTLADTFEQVTGLPASASQPLILEHVTTLKTVMDKQHAGDLAGAYIDLRTAMNHMDQIARPLAGAIVTQQGIPGTVDSQAANLRVALNGLLQEHVFLTGAATGNALAGSTPAFQAAATAINGNTADLSAAVGRIYGPDIQSVFDQLWASHIDLVVDYTNGIAANDTARANDAIVRLTDYVGTLASTLEQVTGLPASTSRGLIQQHVLTLKAAIDAQKAGDLPTAFTNLRAAAAHMQMIADPLAAAIANQQNLT